MKDKITNQMNSAQLERLTNVGGPCVSVQLNLYQQPYMLKHNVTSVEKAVRKAKEALDIFHAPESVKTDIINHLDNVQSKFVNDGTVSGVGLFASGRESQMVTFPFKINECVLVQTSFETRDLLYLKQYEEPYYVLSMSKESIRLFKGITDSFTEIRNEKFPAKFLDDYEYEHASHGASHGYALKGLERDKKEIGAIRHGSFVRDAAHNLSTVLSDPHTQLVVTGPARLLKEFEACYSNRQQVIETMTTSFNGRNFSAFGPTVWSKVVQSRQKRILNLINQVNDLPLSHKVEGIRDVWSAACKGRGRVLLVERDLQRIAYKPDGFEEIRLHLPKGRYQLIADAVDDVIEKVISMQGKVVFTEPKELSSFKGIVLMLRY